STTHAHRCEFASDPSEMKDASESSRCPWTVIPPSVSLSAPVRCPVDVPPTPITSATGAPPSQASVQAASPPFHTNASVLFVLDEKFGSQSATPFTFLVTSESSQ